MRAHCSDSDITSSVMYFAWKDFVWLQENELTHLKDLIYNQSWSLPSYSYTIKALISFVSALASSWK